MQTSPLGQDDAERCKALRRALIKAHEDYVNTAAAEKQVIEQLTEEIERLQKRGSQANINAPEKKFFGLF